MTTEDQPQIYLITPPAFELEPFAVQLANVLDAHEVARQEHLALSILVESGKPPAPTTPCHCRFPRVNGLSSTIAFQKAA